MAGAEFSAGGSQRFPEMWAGFMLFNPRVCLPLAGAASAPRARRRAVPEYGGVAEWSKALVLKTSEPRGSVGSNPTPTAISIKAAACFKGPCLI